MNKNGFVFWEIIISIFLMGLTITFILPLFNNNIMTVKTIESRKEMNYLGEYIFERLKSKDKYSSKLLEQLKDEIEFTDLDPEYIKKYKCKLINLENEEYLWNLKVVIKPIITEGVIENVEIYGTIPK
ncbi:MAG TPA: hypothetical protein VK087_00460 [Tissierellaceae bacterium]|nr:hypothetical protein [Tissierellaceae bacterium]